MAGRTQKRETQDTNSCPGFIPPPDLEFHAVWEAARQAGWPLRDAFVAAAMMRMAGVTAPHAVEAFRACGKWKQ
jgi:hypothetical protein